MSTSSGFEAAIGLDQPVSTPRLGPNVRTNFEALEKIMDLRRRLGNQISDRATRLLNF